MGEGSRHVESVDSTDWQSSSFPEVRVDKRGGSGELWIRIIAHKRSTNVISVLYHVLENESKLEVRSYDMASTEERAVHRILVEVPRPAELDIDDLKSKLYSWADNSAK